VNLGKDRRNSLIELMKIKPNAAPLWSKLTTIVSAVVLVLLPQISSGDEKPSKSEHWSFQDPVNHDPPAVKDSTWSTRAIDPFILARIEEAGLTPNPSAAPQRLIRRLSFDLTGLPPSPEDVAEFEAAFGADSNHATEAMVDRMLASPHFGERWARLWLDVARYAEDQAHIVGSKSDLFYPNAYLYRDWVIGAFNRDLPFSDFIRLQLAADKVESAAESDLAALGFSGLGPKYYRRKDAQVMADEWEDRVDTVTRGFLGLTVSCARCHDHKFDPISTEDYYALAGVFSSTQMFNRSLEVDGDVDKPAKSPDQAMHIVRDNPKPNDLAVHLRGDPQNRGEIVPRRFLTVLSEAGEPQGFAQGSGRRELADAIAKRENPLTARVLVNRIWAELFGSALVATTSNFGILGSLPSHPELLDDLAVRFMEEGWSVKALVKELVLSSTYRQSGETSAVKTEKDPANQLFSRANRKRLAVEMWRDSIFSAAGNLDLKIGGRSFRASDADANRRAVYARISRLRLDPMLALFDHPDPNMHAPGRYESTTALQKLFAMNNPLMVAQAKRLAERLHKEEPDSDSARIQRASRLLYGRAASVEEEQLAVAFLNADPNTGWQQYCQVLLASNELLYLD
jgi:hypothetical protein